MINFYTCYDLKETEEYWLNLGLTLYMKQPNCIILDSKEGQIGFLESKDHQPPVYSCISFTKDTKEEIDELYNKYKDIALAPPKNHHTAPVYSFFMKDPNGLKVEFQTFI